MSGIAPMPITMPVKEEALRYDNTREGGREGREDRGRGREGQRRKCLHKS